LLADKQINRRRFADGGFLSVLTLMSPVPTPAQTVLALAGEDIPRLRAVIGRLSRRLRPTAAGTAAGLTPTRVSVLLHVVRAGSVRLSELAESEGINPTMLSRVVSDLGEAGLLQRVSDDRDRRTAWVKATAAGKRLAERMRRERTDALNVALGELSASERAKLERALPALEALAEALKARPRP
jgi:DNA-binding MarR family transcriptional regulator